MPSKISNIIKESMFGIVIVGNRIVGHSNIHAACFFDIIFEESSDGIGSCKERAFLLIRNSSEN